MMSVSVSVSVPRYEKIHISVNFLALVPSFGALPTMNRGLHFSFTAFFCRTEYFSLICLLNLADFFCKLFTYLFLFKLFFQEADTPSFVI